jgi:protein gp37
MAETSSIEWTDATWNPVTGCSVVSPGCSHCYAMRLAGTRLRHHPSRAGLTRETRGGPVWTGRVRLNEQWLGQPLRWRRGRRIFVCAHGDLFHEAVPDEWIDRVFAIMGEATQHVFQVLTKRPRRMRDYLLAARSGPPKMVPMGDGSLAQHPFNSELKPPRNVWLGVSVEDQKRAEERIPDLLATPAALRFLSCEPLLGPLDLTSIDLAFAEAREAEPSGLVDVDALTGIHFDSEGSVEGVWGSPDPHVDWVIAGGESGQGARPMHPDWVRSLRDQCAAAEVPFFFKQWGQWVPCAANEGEWPAGQGGFCRLNSEGRRTADGWPMQCIGKKASGRLLDGVLHEAMPVLGGAEGPEAAHG